MTRGTYIKWTPEAVQRLRQLAGTMTSKEIAAVFSCTSDAVRVELFRLGIIGRQAKASMDTARIDRMMRLAERCA